MAVPSFTNNPTPVQAISALAREVERRYERFPEGSRATYQEIAHNVLTDGQWSSFGDRAILTSYVDFIELKRSSVGLAPIYTALHSVFRVLKKYTNMDGPETDGEIIRLFYTNRKSKKDWEQFRKACEDMLKIVRWIEEKYPSKGGVYQVAGYKIENWNDIDPAVMNSANTLTLIEVRHLGDFYKYLSGSMRMVKLSLQKHFTAPKAFPAEIRQLRQQVETLSASLQEVQASVAKLQDTKPATPVTALVNADAAMLRYVALAMLLVPMQVRCAYLHSERVSEGQLKDEINGLVHQCYHYLSDAEVHMIVHEMPSFYIAQAFGPKEIRIFEYVRESVEHHRLNPHKRK